jgi:hypothetical protein
MEYCFVEFKVDDKNRFDALGRVFSEIKKDKDANLWRDNEDWLAFFDDAALSNFWPTEEERAELQRRFDTTPVSQRYTARSLLPGWDFESMFDAFKNGEYELIACRMISLDKARLEFDPWAYPYGGIGCMQALIQSFGFLILSQDNGTGYIEFQ